METHEKETFENMPILAVRRACAHLSEDEIQEAEAVFRDYVRLIIEISLDDEARSTLTKSTNRTSVEE